MFSRQYHLLNIGISSKFVLTTVFRAYMHIYSAPTCKYVMLSGELKVSGTFFDELFLIINSYIVLRIAYDLNRDAPFYENEMVSIIGSVPIM